MRPKIKALKNFGLKICKKYSGNSEKCVLLGRVHKIRKDTEHSEKYSGGPEKYSEKSGKNSSRKLPETQKSTPENLEKC